VLALKEGVKGRPFKRLRMAGSVEVTDTGVKLAENEWRYQSCGFVFGRLLTSGRGRSPGCERRSQAGRLAIMRTNLMWENQR